MGVYSACGTRVVSVGAPARPGHWCVRRRLSRCSCSVVASFRQQIVLVSSANAARVVGAASGSLLQMARRAVAPVGALVRPHGAVMASASTGRKMAQTEAAKIQFLPFFLSLFLTFKAFRQIPDQPRHFGLG